MALIGHSFLSLKALQFRPDEERDADHSLNQGRSFSLERKAFIPQLSGQLLLRSDGAQTFFPRRDNQDVALASRSRIQLLGYSAPL
jgi:hypothetical protein